MFDDDDDIDTAATDYRDSEVQAINRAYLEDEALREAGHND